MDPIHSSTARVVSSAAMPADTANKIQKLAEELKALDVTTPEGSRRMLEINRQLMIFAGAPAAAGAADIPEPPYGSDRGIGQDVLDKAFKEIADREEEMKTLDPTTPAGAKRMTEITHIMNRCDEMIKMVNDMRRSRHEANMRTLDNIA